MVCSLSCFLYSFFLLLLYIVSWSCPVFCRVGYISSCRFLEGQEAALGSVYQHFFVRCASRSLLNFFLTFRWVICSFRYGGRIMGSVIPSSVYFGRSSQTVLWSDIARFPWLWPPWQMCMWVEMNIVSIGRSPYACVDVPVPYFCSIGLYRFISVISLVSPLLLLVSSLKSPMTTIWCRRFCLSLMRSLRSCRNVVNTSADVVG